MISAARLLWSWSSLGFGASARVACVCVCVPLVPLVCRALVRPCPAVCGVLCSPCFSLCIGTCHFACVSADFLALWALAGPFPLGPRWALPSGLCLAFVWGSFWAPPFPCCPLGPCWGLGRPLGPCWAFLGPLLGAWPLLGPSLWLLVGPPLGSCWALPGPLGPLLGPPFPWSLGPLFGPSLGPLLGSSLGPLVFHAPCAVARFCMCTSQYHFLQVYVSVSFCICFRSFFWLCGPCWPPPPWALAGPFPWALAWPLFGALSGPLPSLAVPWAPFGLWGGPGSLLGLFVGPFPLAPVGAWGAPGSLLGLVVVPLLGPSLRPLFLWAGVGPSPWGLVGPLSGAFVWPFPGSLVGLFPWALGLSRPVGHGPLLHVFVSASRLHWYVSFSCMCLYQRHACIGTCPACVCISVTLPKLRVSDLDLARSLCFKSHDPGAVGAAPGEATRPPLRSAMKSVWSGWVRSLARRPRWVPPAFAHTTRVFLLMRAAMAHAYRCCHGTRMLLQHIFIYEGTWFAF